MTTDERAGKRRLDRTAWSERREAEALRGIGRALGAAWLPPALFVRIICASTWRLCVFAAQLRSHSTRAVTPKARARTCVPHKPSIGGR